MHLISIRKTFCKNVITFYSRSLKALKKSANFCIKCFNYKSFIQLSLSGSASTTNLAMQERDVNLNHIQSTANTSSTTAAIFSSPFHIENNLQNNNKPRAQVPLMNISGTSSNYTINTTATIDTTDSGISTDGMSKKRHKFWNLLGGGGGGKNKNSSSTNKQKSATLGREKERKKDKKDLGRDSEERHRWSTGLPKLSPLPANVSKEKLCQLLDAKLNDSQLFLEFERIPKRKENGQYTCALLEENYSKNSDPTCLPMDENRVKLIPTRENRIGYVNASYVSVSKFICA
jgi:tyrosine-protein phosphatase non-receptor type 14/21